MENSDHRLAAVLYADIAGFSRMMESDETGTLKSLSQLNTLAQRLIEECRGKLIKTIGDAYLADFKTALDAVKCAIQIQHELAALNTDRQDKKLLLRIGIHLGDIYFFENDALGEGINIASRLQGACKPGRVCISSEIYNQIAQKIDLPIKDLGVVKLKNITREVRAYEIRTDSSMYNYESGERLEEPLEENRSKNPGAFPPIEFDDIKRLVKETITYAGRKLEEEILIKAPPFREYPENYQSRSKRHFRYPGEEEERYALLTRKEIRQLRKEKRLGLSPARYYESYKRRVESDARKARSGFRGHLIPYCAVAGFLLVLNIVTGSSFPWFLFPVGGWGIGIFIHGMLAREQERKKQDLDKLPPLSEEQTFFMRKIHKIRESFKGHLSATIAVSGFLAMVNLITSPSFLWFLIPSAALTMSLMAHWASFSGKRRELNNRLKESLSLAPPRDYSDAPSSSGIPENSPVILEAKRLEKIILGKAAELKDPALLEEMNTVLPEYINQIRTLTQKEKEIQELLRSIPLNDLEADKQKLTKHISQTSDPVSKREYAVSLSELDKQLSSFRQLHDRGELVTLKIQSSLNSLRKMQADLLSISDSAKNTPYSIDSLKRRTDELSDYLNDLDKGYKEID